MKTSSNPELELRHWSAGWEQVLLGSQGRSPKGALPAVSAEVPGLWDEKAPSSCSRHFLFAGLH